MPEGENARMNKEFPCLGPLINNHIVQPLIDWSLLTSAGVPTVFPRLLNNKWIIEVKLGTGKKYGFRY